MVHLRFKAFTSLVCISHASTNNVYVVHKRSLARGDFIIVPQQYNSGEGRVIVNSARQVKMHSLPLKRVGLIMPIPLGHPNDSKLTLPCNKWGRGASKWKDIVARKGTSLRPSVMSGGIDPNSSQSMFISRMYLVIMEHRTNIDIPLYRRRERNSFLGIINYGGTHIQIVAHRHSKGQPLYNQILHVVEGRVHKSRSIKGSIVTIRTAIPDHSNIIRLGNRKPWHDQRNITRRNVSLKSQLKDFPPLQYLNLPRR